VTVAAAAAAVTAAAAAAAAAEAAEVVKAGAGWSARRVLSTLCRPHMHFGARCAHASL